MPCLLSFLSSLFSWELRSQFLIKSKDMALFAKPLLCTLSYPMCQRVCCRLGSASQLRWCFSVSFYTTWKKHILHLLGHTLHSNKWDRVRGRLYLSFASTRVWNGLCSKYILNDQGRCASWHPQFHLGHTLLLISFFFCSAFHSFCCNLAVLSHHSDRDQAWDLAHTHTHSYSGMMPDR